ncbi:MAG: AMP-binding protein [Clostridiales Family XIII bacterium]|jgi:phenylacetate-coenzyme A ligase PaaK-like adenylate-forming protein|nr:AMP-binding protein [Clostridiales Family XIII bacterium]
MSVEISVDRWIGEKIGLERGAALTRDALSAYQLARLRETVAYAKTNSAFYGRAFADIDPDADIRDLSDLARLPLMDAASLIAEGAGMVCVSASEVSRIVTLETGGSTGKPKRVYFTEDDQELMIDYIRHGLRVMAQPGDVFLVLMPCERPGSVGDLVRIGLERIGVEVIPLGILPFDGSMDDETLVLMRKKGVNSMLATASAAVRLAEKSVGDAILTENMRTLLLSAEYVSGAARASIERAWDCKVYEHYGMTEMGLGGAMACESRIGYHPREADILFEILDPETGAVVPKGAYGEVVFTTLTRRAMPFIRYRTGDFSRWIPGRCPCGSILKRLDRVGNRKAMKGY